MQLRKIIIELEHDIVKRKKLEMKMVKEDEKQMGKIRAIKIMMMMMIMELLNKIHRKKKRVWKFSLCFSP